MACRRPSAATLAGCTVLLAATVQVGLAWAAADGNGTFMAPAWPNLLSQAGRHAAMSLPKSHPRHLDPDLEDLERAKRQEVVNPKAEFEKWRARIAAGTPPNVRANDPAGDQTTTADTQSECAVAAFGNNVVAAWNDSKGLRLMTPTTVSSYAYSSNGGATWTDGGNLSLLAAGDQAFGDCTLDVDASGNFYLSDIYVTAAGNQNIAVRRGTFSAGVLTWGLPVMAATAPLPEALDKNYLTCDRANGNLYVSYTRFGAAVGIEVVRGTALGTTWSAPVVLDNTTGGVQGSRPIVGPEGNLYVCWQSGWGTIQCDLSSSTTGTIALRRCTSPTSPVMVFDATVTVGTVQANWTSYWAGNLRANGLFFPDMAVDRSGGSNNGNVYVIWNESAPWTAQAASGISTDELEANDAANAANVKSINPGDNATGIIGTAGDFDYWKINVTVGQHLMLRLEPQGFNCGVAVTTRNFQLRMYKGSTPTAGDSILGNSNLNGFASEIVFDAPETAAYFFRVRNVNGSGPTTGTYTVKSRLLTYGTPSPARDMRDVVVARSTNHGVSFLAQVVVNNDAANSDNCIPAITVDGSGWVHAFWYDNRDEPSRILRSYYHGVSVDGGASFPINKRITDELLYFNLNTVAVPNYGEYNQAYAQGTRVYASWSDERISHGVAGGSGVDCYVTGVNTVSGLEFEPALPRAVALFPNEPNPFNPSTRVGFELPKGGPVDLTIFRVDGRRVRVLVHAGRLEPGRYSTIWNGTDSEGRAMPSGAYVLHLRVGEETHSRRIVLLK